MHHLNVYEPRFSSRSIAILAISALIGGGICASALRRHPVPAPVVGEAEPVPLSGKPRLKKQNYDQLTLRLEVLNLPPEELRVVQRFASDPVSRQLKNYFIGLIHVQAPADRQLLADHALDLARNHRAQAVARLKKAVQVIPQKVFPAQWLAFRALLSIAQAE